MPVMSTHGPLEPVQFLFILAILASSNNSPFFSYTKQWYHTIGIIIHYLGEEANSCMFFSCCIHESTKNGAQKDVRTLCTSSLLEWGRIRPDCRQASVRTKIMSEPGCEPKLGMGHSPSRRFSCSKGHVHLSSRPIPMITKVATQLTMLIFWPGFFFDSKNLQQAVGNKHHQTWEFLVTAKVDTGRPENCR